VKGVPDACRSTPSTTDKTARALLTRARTDARSASVTDGTPPRDGGLCTVMPSLSPPRARSELLRDAGSGRPTPRPVFSRCDSIWEGLRPRPGAPRRIDCGRRRGGSYRGLPAATGLRIAAGGQPLRSGRRPSRWPIASTEHWTGLGSSRSGVPKSLTYLPRGLGKALASPCRARPSRGGRRVG